MFGFLRRLNVVRQWREAFEKRFAKAFSVPFPKNEEERERIQSQVMARLVEIGGEAESARVEYKSHTLSFSGLPEGVRMMKALWLTQAANVAHFRGKEYKQMRKLAQRAGFARPLLDEADQLAKVAGAQGGLIFTT